MVSGRNPISSINEVLREGKYTRDKTKVRSEIMLLSNSTQTMAAGFPLCRYRSQIRGQDTARTRRGAHARPQGNCAWFSPRVSGECCSGDVVCGWNRRSSAGYRSTPSITSTSRCLPCDRPLPAHPHFHGADSRSTAIWTRSRPQLQCCAR